MVFAAGPAEIDAASPGRNSVTVKMAAETARRVTKIRASRMMRKRPMAQTSSQEFVKLKHVGPLERAPMGDVPGVRGRAIGHAGLDKSPRR